MRVVAEKGNKNYIRDRKKSDLTRIEPPKRLFKVVVNNYNHQQKEIVDKVDEVDDETLESPEIGLPPQPTSYLKYPEHDWL